MKANNIFIKTLPFVWAKLLLGLATVAISIGILAVVLGIGWLFNSKAVYIIMVAIWLAATGYARFFIMQYIGYLVKAGHVAVITEAVTTGRIPDNQVAYGKEVVKERFATSNVYFVIDKLVAGSVKQLQHVMKKASNVFDFIPGMAKATNVINMFIGIALGYIDECCLGYTFHKKEQNAFKSAADGVVIYAQNWKKLMKDAAKTTVIVLVLLAVTTIVTFAVFGGLFRAFGWNGLVAFLLACFVTWAIKFAFIDSYMMVQMMTSYMEEAPKTEITFDLYGKLCGWSAKFKELWNKAQSEETKQSQTSEPVYVEAGTIQQPDDESGEKPVSGV